MTSNGGYMLKKHREFFDGAGFEADLYKDGKLLGQVTNAGRGGCNMYHLPFAEKNALFAHAAEVMDVTFEPEDAFVERLRTAAVITAKRSRVFITDDMDPFADGRMYLLPAAVPVEKAVSILAKDGRSNIRTWDKKAQDFVPVAAAA